MIKGKFKKIQNTEMFILASKNIFDDKFTYNNTFYTNKRAKLIITCVKHGDFKVVPNKHLYSNGGCRKCILQINEEKFFAMANIAHDGKYCYGKSIYRGTGKI